MTNQSMWNNLKSDISIITVPDVWDKIKDIKTKENFSADLVPYKAKRYWAVITASVTIVVFAVAFLINYNYSGDQSSPMYTISNQESSLNVETLYVLKNKKFHGELNKTQKSSNTIKAVLLTYTDADNIENIYEDNKYLYHFNNDGEVIEMASISNKNSDKEYADRSTISTIVAQIFEQYLPNAKQSDYVVNIEENENSYPQWTVTAKLMKNDICVSKIFMTFNSKGDLLQLILPSTPLEELNQAGMTRMIEIGINEAVKDKYGLSSDRNDYKNISMEIKNSAENGAYCNIKFDYVPLKAYPQCTSAFALDINISTGEILEVYMYK